MALKGEFIQLPVSDGTQMRTYVVHPEGAPKGAIIVFQEIFGINTHIRDIAGRFAQQGYLAIAPEMFHRFAPNFECGYTPDEVQAAMKLIPSVTREGLEADIHAAHDWLQTHHAGLKIGAVGYCMGGRLTFLATSLLPLACGVSYYGGGIAPNQYIPAGLLDRAPEMKAPILMFWGGKDGMIPPEAVQQVTGALRAAGKTFANVEFSWADHGFFCNERGSYNADAAAAAWPLTLAFLKTHVG
jgi:carboxymethylenebutenolidase